MVRDSRLHDADVEQLVGHVQDLVLAVIPDTADLREGSGTDQRTAVVLTILCGLHRDIFQCALAAHHLRRCHDSVDDLLVAGAAADVPGLVEPLPDIGSGGVRVLLKQSVGGNDKSGNAEAALHRAALHESVLDGMGMHRSADAFHGDDLAVLFDLRDLPGAGTDQLSVKDHST